VKRLRQSIFNKEQIHREGKGFRALPVLLHFATKTSSLLLRLKSEIYLNSNGDTLSYNVVNSLVLSAAYGDIAKLTRFYGRASAGDTIDTTDTGDSGAATHCCCCKKDVMAASWPRSSSDSA
jgi:hypothetical protein